MAFKSIRKIIILFCIFLTVTASAQIPNEFDKYLTKTDTTNLFWKVDNNPSFKGGHAALVKFYQENFVYPKVSRKKGIEGTIYVLFIVETNGKITNVYATNTIDGFLEKEAVRFIKKMPRWNPGNKDGKAVRVLNIQPVKFKLE